MFRTDELDDAPGLSGLASVALRDSRRDKTTVRRIDGLFRQSIHGRLAGYEDVNNTERHNTLDGQARSGVTTAKHRSLGGCRVIAYRGTIIDRRIYGGWRGTTVKNILNCPV